MKIGSHPSCADAISDALLFTEEIVSDAMPGLQDAVAARDWALCAHLLADRMRAKPAPSFCRYTGEPGPVAPAEQRKADEILDGTFTLTDARGGHITERLVGEFEWSPSFKGLGPYDLPKPFYYALNQHEPLGTLARVFWQTGEERYRDRLVSLLLDWIRRVPTWSELGPWDEGERQHWQNMNARNRFDQWLGFYPLIAPILSDRDAVDLLKAAIYHTEIMDRYVVDHMGDRLTGTLAGMMRVNLKFAILFPEAAAAGRVIDTFRVNFGTAIDTVFYPDGGLKFRCAGYHRAVSGWYVEADQLARELGIEGLEDEMAMTRKMEAWTLGLMKPDASLPLLGDTGQTGIPDILAGGPAEGRRDQPSQAFPWSGLYAMRSGWDAEDLYLFFTAGPYGTMHNHQDHLSFEVSGYGGPLIVEPGITPYGRTEQKAYLTASPAHNTVTVDGLGQHRVHVEPDSPSTNPWVLTDRFEFVEGVFNEGFGPDRPLAVTHVRSICFIKPRAFLVVDRLLGEGDQDLVWHFMFYPQSLQVASGGCSALSDEAGGPNVKFTWSDPALLPELVVAETEPPYRGLMTADQDRACPSLLLRRKAVLPCCVSFLIEPLRPGAQSQLSIDHPDVQDAIAFVESNTRVPFENGRCSS